MIFPSFNTAVCLAVLAGSVVAFPNNSSSSSSSSSCGGGGRRGNRRAGDRSDAGLFPDDPADALIIGGGPGGLGVAAGLARMRHTARVFDSGDYRNAKATHMHNVLGWDHVSPKAYRRKVRCDLESRYDGIAFTDTTITSVRKLDTADGGGFEVHDIDGRRYYGRKLALAHGVKDIMPDLPGYADCWPQGM